MRRVIIYAIFLFALLGIGLFFVFSIKNKDSAQTIVKAHRLFQNNDFKPAETILRKILAKDIGNEDACVLLAKISDKKNEFDVAGYYWKRAALLNPLNNDYKLEALKFAAICRDDKSFLDVYNSLANKTNIPDYLKYNAAMMFLRDKNLFDALSISDNLIKSKSQYALLLSANMSMRKSDYSDSKLKFNQILSGNFNQDIQDSAILGLVSLELLENATPKKSFVEYAEKMLSKYKGSPYTKSDFHRIKSAIASINGDDKKSSEQLQECLKIESSNILLLLQINEIALAQGDKDTISKYRKEINQSTKDMVKIQYYLRAMEDFLNKDYKKSLHNLKLCNELSVRLAYKFLDAKVSLSASDPTNAIRALNKIDASEVKESGIVSDLERYIRANTNSLDDSQLNQLIQNLVRLSPSNEISMRYNINKEISLGNFQKALELCEILGQKVKEDRMLYEATVIALYSNRKFKDALLKTLPNSKDDDVFSTYMSGKIYQSMDNNSEARKYFIKALKLNMITRDMSFNIAEFFAKNCKDTILEDSKLFNKEINKDISLRLKADAAIKMNDLETAYRYLKEVILIDKSPSAFENLAFFEFKYINIDAAKKRLEDAIKEIGNDSNLTLRLALLYLSSEEKSSAEIALKYLRDSQKKNPKNSLTYIGLSRAYSILGNNLKAFQAIETAESIDRSNVEIARQKSNIYIKNGEYESAVKTLLSSPENDKLIESQTENALQLYLQKEKRLYGAEMILEDFLKKYPNNNYAKIEISNIRKKIEKTR